MTGRVGESLSRLHKQYGLILISYSLFLICNLYWGGSNLLVNQLIIDVLRIESMTPDEIETDAPLFEEGIQSGCSRRSHRQQGLCFGAQHGRVYCGASQMKALLTTSPGTVAFFNNYDCQPQETLCQLIQFNVCFPPKQPALY